MNKTVAPVERGLDVSAIHQRERKVLGSQQADFIGSPISVCKDKRGSVGGFYVASDRGVNSAHKHLAVLISVKYPSAFP